MFIKMGLNNISHATDFIITEYCITWKINLMPKHPGQHLVGHLNNTGRRIWNLESKRWEVFEKKHKNLSVARDESVKEVGRRLHLLQRNTFFTSCHRNLQEEFSEIRWEKYVVLALKTRYDQYDTVPKLWSEKVDKEPCQHPSQQQYSICTAEWGRAYGKPLRLCRNMLLQSFSYSWI